ncbi:MAG TPA: BamA/TamA family outer membrane protein, partial [Rhizomicrobium sp.]|nr:BamA/TamA family outer membrane protein [Rhizomicrobium sp.]
NDRFFKGGDSFRGFQLAGIGPRVLGEGSRGSVGGNTYAIGTFELRLPDYLPADYGISTSLFTDFGTLGHTDAPASSGGCATAGSIAQGNCIKDNLGFRMSAGVAIGWKSPFGPVEIDLGLPIVKQSYDKTQIIRFSAGTGY